MKKTISVILCVLTLIPCFAKGLFVQPNVGYGYLSGSRYMTWKDGHIDNQVALKGCGIEVGVLTGYQFNNTWGLELYFDYLFALKGSFDPLKAPNPTVIEKNVKFTDYKAGIGAQYRFNVSNKDSIRLATGLNFTGISNHYYEGKTEIGGNKVTSFGLYLAAGEIHNLNKNLSLTANVHTCLNPLGFIRNFNTEKGKWTNYLPKDGTPHVKCFSIFGQIGLLYSI